ncbi:O-antigen ligase family protein [Clostridium perfringens]
MSFYIPKISAISILLYLSWRIFSSKEEETLYFILLLSANTNIFFIFGAPICNLIILISLIRLIMKGSILSTNPFIISIILCIYELLHSVVYDYFNIFQSIVWCGSILFVSIYISNCISKYNNSKAKLYFFGSVLISSIYGVYYRIYSGQGFSVDSFNINDSARFGGGFYDPNYFALVSLIIFAFIIGHFSNKNKEKDCFEIIPNWIYSITFIVLLFFCIAGLSKMFVLVLLLLIVFVIPIFFNFSKNSSRLILSIIIISITVIIIIKISSYDFLGIFDKIIERFKSASTLNELTTGRSNLISYTLDFLKEHPLYLIFGVGVQSYGMRMGEGYLHSYPIEILATYGIIGSAIYIAFFLSLYKSSKKYFKSINILYSFKYVELIPLIIFGICSISLNIVEVEIFYPLILMLILNLTYRKEL